jgi:N-acetylmuramoyl-L-alanine amidase
MGKYIIAEPGDCLVNLSAAEGFLWETIWNHPENAELRRKRRHYNILKAGDRLFIPDLEVRSYSGATETRHHFVRKGVPVRFTVALATCGRPRANERYVLMLDNGSSREGTTDDEGVLDEPIPPDVREGRLLLDDEQEEFLIRFGHLDPIQEVSGVQTRLRNLGFYEGEIDGELSPETTAAIAEFKRSRNLPGEGALTDEVRQALVAAHRS